MRIKNIILILRLIYCNFIKFKKQNLKISKLNWYLCIKILFTFSVSMWKMARQRWTEAQGDVEEHPRVQVWFYRTCHKGEKVSCTGVIAISKCRQNQCHGTVLLPVRGEFINFSFTSLQFFFSIVSLTVIFFIKQDLH